MTGALPLPFVRNSQLEAIYSNDVFKDFFVDCQQVLKRFVRDMTLHPTIVVSDVVVDNSRKSMARCFMLRLLILL